MSGYTEIALLQYEIKKLRAERSALRAELREICTALDDAACDLVPTAVECIKKLKAENEWQPIETAEACAKYIDSTNGNIRGVNTVFSKALRSGAWKEFKK